MKLFLTSSFAACCVLALPSFAFMPTSGSPSTPLSSSTTGGATHKVQSVTTTVTTVVNETGEKTETRVTRLECSGAAYDCKLTRLGDAEYVTPIGL